MLPVARIAALAAFLAATPVWSQSGLRVPERAEPGLDPSFARGWLAAEYDRFGFAAYQWRDAYGFAPGARIASAYDVGAQASFTMSLARPRDWDLEPRPLSLFGRYWFTPDWAVSAESLSRDATGLFRLQDFRIGVQRRF
ncbi:MAG: hypothetical protein ABR570_00955 [Burkholderiales bacterium]